MTLLDAHSGQTVVVTDILGGWGSRRRLAELGVFPGARLRVVSHAAFGGPLLVDVGGRVVAVGRGVAGKVIVRPD